jgi:hypothetical protein
MATHTTPRMLYRGAADDTAGTCVAQNDDELADMLKQGYRLQRVDKKHAAPEATDTIKVPAQTITTSAATAKDKK